MWRANGQQIVCVVIGEIYILCNSATNNYSSPTLEMCPRSSRQRRTIAFAASVGVLFDASLGAFLSVSIEAVHAFLARFHQILGKFTGGLGGFTAGLGVWCWRALYFYSQPLTIVHLQLSNTPCHTKKLLRPSCQRESSPLGSAPLM